MPSVTDVPQQSSNIHGKSTPPPPSSTSNSNDPNQFDAMLQSVQVFEKKLRNLVKRKDKLEGYEQEEKRGKELNKDQKEALAKYPEVLGQIDCVKELSEQLKKIQTDAQKHQKRLAKQSLEEKRLLIHQRVSEYAQIRYLLDHRPNTLKEEESTLLDQLSSLIVPNDNSTSTMTTSVDAVLSIYQGGSTSTKIKSLTGKTVQEIKEILEQLIKSSQQQPTSSTVVEFQSNDEQIDQIQPEVIPTVVQPPPPPSVVAAPTEEEEEAETTTINDQENLPHRTLHEYPLKFDTREQNIPLEQIIKDSPFLPNEPIQTQQLGHENHSDQYKMLSTNNPEQSSTLISNLEQTNDSTSGPSAHDYHQHEEQWQQTRPNNNQRNNQQYNQNSRYHYQNRPPHNYYPSGSHRGARGGRYNNNSYAENPSAAGGQRPFHENQNRGRGTPNPNYRGNRGGNYRGGGGHRGNGTYQGNGNNYQKGQYYANNDQQIRSAPPSASSTADHQ